MPRRFFARELCHRLERADVGDRTQPIAPGAPGHRQHSHYSAPTAQAASPDRRQPAAIARQILKRVGIAPLPVGIIAVLLCGGVFGTVSADRAAAATTTAAPARAVITRSSVRITGGTVVIDAGRQPNDSGRSQSIAVQASVTVRACDRQVIAGGGAQLPRSDCRLIVTSLP